MWLRVFPLKWDYKAGVCFEYVMLNLGYLSKYVDEGKFNRSAAETASEVILHAGIVILPIFESFIIQ